MPRPASFRFLGVPVPRIFRYIRYQIKIPDNLAISLRIKAHIQIKDLAGDVQANLFHDFTEVGQTAF